jgi:hypothetical protein
VAKVLAIKAKQQTDSDDVLRKVPTRPRNQEVRSLEHLLPEGVIARPLTHYACSFDSEHSLHFDHG